MSVNYEALGWALFFIPALVACYGALTRESLTDGQAGAAGLLLVGTPFFWIMCIIGVGTKEAECKYGGDLFDYYSCQPWGWMWFVAPSFVSFVVFVCCLVRKWTKE